MTVVRSLWKGLIEREPTMQALASEVAQRHGLTLDQLRGSSCARPITIARQEAMSAIMATRRFSLCQCGRFFNRDHTTVRHAIKRLGERRAA